MKAPLLRLSLGFAASLALLSPRTAAAQEANGFGEKGELIISADRLMSFISYSRDSVDETNGNLTTTEAESSTSIALLLGREASNPTHVNPHTIPRIAFDYVVIPHLTVGGSFVLGLGLGGSLTTKTSGNGPDTSTSTDAPTVTAVGIAARAGYVLPLGQSIAFWPRAGFAYYSLSSKTTTTDGNNNNATSEIHATDTAFSLDLDPQFVWVPVSHFFINAGPLINIPLAGKASTTTDAGGTSIEKSDDLHYFHIGLSAGFGGWFDL